MELRTVCQGLPVAPLCAMHAGVNTARTPTPCPALSVVIAAHNEAERLPATLATLATYCKETGLECEVIVVDDRSRDETLALAQRSAPELAVRAVRLAGRGGVGMAVRAGLRLARGEHVLVCDADGAVPFACLPALRAALRQGYALAIGSRRAAEGGILARQPAHRVAIGHVWRLMVQVLAPTGVRDTQCGFKVMTGALAHAFAEQTHCRSFAFHVELLLLARRLGHGVAELPVVWRDQPGSKVRVVRDALLMTLELTQLCLASTWVRDEPWRPWRALASTRRPQLGATPVRPLP